MNDARLDALLAAADPLVAPLPEGVCRDDAARAARARIRASRRRVTIPRVAAAVAGFAALAVLVVALVVAVPGREGEPAAGALIAPADRTPMRSFDVPMLILGESHRVGWNLPRGAPAVVAPHPAIVTFADTGCAECRGNVVAVQRLWATTAVGDLAALGVAGPLDGRARELTAWWHGLGATFPLAVDRGHAASRALGVGDAPVTVVVDRQSRVAARFEGAVDPASLGSAVRAVLAEPLPAWALDPAPIPGPVPPSALRLGVFDLPPASDSPPPGLLSFTPRVYSQSIRLALRSPSGHEIWVARAAGDYIVIADGRNAFGASRASEIARKGGVYFSGGDGHGTWHFAGMAADGYTRATGDGRSVPIRDNVFLFEGGRRFSRVTLTGPAGTRTLGR